MNFSIPVQPDHIRTIKDPINENVRIVHALVNVNDLPDNIPLEPDPRQPKPTSKVTKVITNSLTSNSGRFHLLNRGITLCVEKYDFDNKAHLLKLLIPEPSEKYGIIDGGHTHFSICEAVKQERKLVESGNSAYEWEGNRVFDNQFVHIEILEGVESNLAEIAEARNFSIQLKNWTLAHYRHEFDWLLDALGRGDADKIINFGDGEDQPVGILDVIQVLGATNPSLFKDEKPAREAYTSAGKILNDFIDPTDPADFKSLSDVAADILELYDYVRLHFREQYNKRGGKFRATKEAKAMAKKRGAKAIAKYWWLGRNKPRLNGEIAPVEGKDPIDKGLAIPLISGFRALLEKVDGKYQWLAQPKPFFDRYGDKLVDPIMAASDDETREPWFVGRNPTVYTQLTSEVRRWYLEDREAARTLAAKSK